MTDAGIARYYDRLNRWNDAARVVGYGGGRERLTVHRALADPAAGGRPTTTRLHDVLLAHLPHVRGVRVLDAGSGLGGTMLLLAERLGADVTGLTLSPSQARTARGAIEASGLSARARVLVQSYDDPPAGPFALVVALESLAHSPSPAASVAALARVLAPGGTLAIVDDMPEPAAEGHGDLVRFRRGWRSPVVFRRDQYLDLFRVLGLALQHDLDLSEELRPRPLRRIARLERLNRLTHALVPAAGVREVMDSHLAGLALERLQRQRLMCYRMLVARKPINP